MNNKEIFSIQGVQIGEGSPCFIIAEIAQAHDGSLGMAHSYIDAAAEAGADAVKFQTHIAKAESTRQEPFRVKFSYEDSTRYSYWKRMEFTKKQWRGLKEHCNELGVVFLSSPFSVEAVKLLDDIGISAWKVGSGEVNNPVLLKSILKTSKPILLSSGMSDWSEIDKNIFNLKEKGATCAIFQCTSKYPTHIREVGLNVIDDMRERYSIPVGLSDHSGRISPSIAAIANKVNLIEVHVVFDKQMFGPDAQSSLTLQQLKRVVEFKNDFYEMERHPVDKNLMANDLNSIKSLFNKSVVAKTALPKGLIIQMDDLTVKKPCTGIPAKDIGKCIGKKLKNNVPVDHFLDWMDFED